MGYEKFRRLFSIDSYSHVISPEALEAYKFCIESMGRIANTDVFGQVDTNDQTVTVNIRFVRTNADDPLPEIVSAWAWPLQYPAFAPAQLVPGNVIPDGGISQMLLWPEDRSLREASISVSTTRGLFFQKVERSFPKPKGRRLRIDYAMAKQAGVNEQEIFEMPDVFISAGDSQTYPDAPYGTDKMQVRVEVLADYRVRLSTRSVHTEEKWIPVSTFMVGRQGGQTPWCFVRAETLDKNDFFLE